MTTVIDNYEFVPFRKEVYNVQSNSESSEKSNSYLSCESCDTLHHLDEKCHVSHDHIRDGLIKCYGDYVDLFDLIEPLTGLQLALQPVTEALVLLDRLAYLKERHFDKVWLKEVFDVAISPRNVALIAIR